MSISALSLSLKTRAQVAFGNGHVGAYRWPAQHHESVRHSRTWAWTEGQSGFVTLCAIHETKADLKDKHFTCATGPTLKEVPTLGVLQEGGVGRIK